MREHLRLHHRETSGDLLPEERVTGSDPIALRRRVELEQHQAVEQVDEVPLVHRDPEEHPVLAQFVDDLLDPRTVPPPGARLQQLGCGFEGTVSDDVSRRVRPRGQAGHLVSIERPDTSAPQERGQGRLPRTGVPAHECGHTAIVARGPRHVDVRTAQ
jgi:hypothetical protein